MVCGVFMLGRIGPDQYLAPPGNKYPSILCAEQFYNILIKDGDVKKPELEIKPQDTVRFYFENTELTDDLVWSLGELLQHIQAQRIVVDFGYLSWKACASSLMIHCLIHNYPDKNILIKMWGYEVNELGALKYDDIAAIPGIAYFLLPPFLSVDELDDVLSETSLYSGFGRADDVYHMERGHISNVKNHSCRSSKHSIAICKTPDQDPVVRIAHSISMN